MTRTLPGLGLTAFWPLGDNTYKNAMDANIRSVSALVMPSVLSIADTPTSNDGDIYIVATGANANNIAIRDNGAWVYISPQEGWMAWVKDEDKFYVYTDAWREYISPVSGGGGDPVVIQTQLTDFKDSVRAATTANITLSGEQTIDGVSIIGGNRVLVKDQTTGSENGIYVAASGAWSRATDADEDAEVTTGMLVFVDEGTAAGNQIFALLTPDPIVVGTTALTFDNIVLPAGFAPVKSSNATAYTLLTSDPGRWIRFTHNSNPSVTVPGSSTKIAVGAEIWVQYTGTGTLTIAPAGGVTLDAPDGLTLSQYQVFKLKKTTANRWSVILYGAKIKSLSVHDRGTISTGTHTPEWSDGEMQKGVNNGAHTLAAMTNIGYYILTYTNGASAGVITASGWDSVTDPDAVLGHVVQNSVIELSAYNDGVSKRLIVALIEDATP